MFKFLRYIQIAVFVLSVISFNSCKLNYSMTGASIQPEVKTVSIHYFKNNASLINPMLSQQLTDALRDRFSSQTNLNLVNNNGDLDILGQITNYNTSPIAIQGNETAAMNRLTITISVKYTNKFNEKQNFETSFSRFENYPSTQTLSTVESTIVKQIIDYLIDDIFNKTVVNW